jgi:hypothetical protein
MDELQTAVYGPDVDGTGVCVFIGDKRIAKLENGKWIALEPGYEVRGQVFLNGVAVASFYGMKVGGYVAFNGYSDDPPDVDGAEIALRRAGFHVIRMPEKLRSRGLPLDDFLLAVTDGPHDDKFVSSTIWDEIKAVVDRYGGDVFECGLIESDELEHPFENLFVPGLLPDDLEHIERLLDYLGPRQQYLLGYLSVRLPNKILRDYEARRQGREMVAMN